MDKSDTTARTVQGNFAQSDERVMDDVNVNVEMSLQDQTCDYDDHNDDDDSKWQKMCNNWKKTKTTVNKS